MIDLLFWMFVLSMLALSLYLYRDERRVLKGRRRLLEEVEEYLTKRRQK